VISKKEIEGYMEGSKNIIHNNFAVIIPMANEEKDFFPFINQLKTTLNNLRTGTVYFVVDKVSKDNTLDLCQKMSAEDPRFITLWAPENKNVVDAYIRGYQEAYHRNHDIVIEMDAGLSHDPAMLINFINILNSGYDCAFGSRNIIGGSNTDSSISRRFLSASGTLLANILLGTKLKDMTSGYQGFRREIVAKLICYPLRSTAHFYQTEVRYLLRNYTYVETPIHYRSPSPRVSWKAIKNSFQVLGYYTFKRLLLKENYL